MKKFLFTCFLAPLCLLVTLGIGSTPFLSLVAQSPGADSLPTSIGPHRGGSFRSDAFTQFEDLSETSGKAIYTTDVSAIDGGPRLWSSDIRYRTALPSPVSGLPASNKETASLRASARSDARLHRKSVIGHPTSLPSPVACTEHSRSARLPSQINFGLINTDQDLGLGLDELNSHSTPVPVLLDKGLYKNGYAIHTPFDFQEGEWHLEITSNDLPDTVWITYWEHLLSDGNTITPGTILPLVGEKGTFFEGSSGSKVFTWHLPEVKQGYVSVSIGKTEIIRHWAFFQGDRLRLRFDLNRAQAFFGGPQELFFKTQYLIDQHFQEEKFNSNPVLVANHTAGLESDHNFQAAYQKAKGKPTDIHVRLQVLTPKTNGWEHLQEVIETPIYHHPAWKILNGKEELTPNQRAMLSSRILGEILSKASQRADAIADQLQNEPEKAIQLFTWADQGIKTKPLQSHPGLVQSLTSLEILRSKIKGNQVLDLLEAYPDQLRDELIGFFLLNNHNRLKEHLEPYLLQGLKVVQTPWIYQRLSMLYEVKLGSFVSTGLYNEQGQPVDLSKYRGRTILLQYWISGCKFCMDDFQKVLKPLQAHVGDREDFLLVTVNADGKVNSWINSLSTGNYTSPEMLNLRVDLEAGLLERYQIHSFPQKMILGPDTRILLQSLDRMDSEELISRLFPDSAIPKIPNQSKPTIDL